MIRSLAIRDLVVIAAAELEPGPGLTAITGETGAGKTVLAQALALLAGAPADQSAVRPGAKHALVEATIALPAGFWDALDDDSPALALRELVEHEDEIVVARRIPAEGRARSLVDGQATSREAVAALVAALVRFSGQHAQRQLVSSSRQLAILDGFAGSTVVAQAAAVREQRRALRALDREVEAIAERRRRAAAEREELAELVAAVDAVGPDLVEEATLRADRERLLHGERLREGIEDACAALGDGDAGGAIGRAGTASSALLPLGVIVPALGDLGTRLGVAQETLQEALLELRGELGTLDADPGRLDALEERLGEYQRLDRRYGPGTERVLQVADEARVALASLVDGEERDAHLDAERGALLAATATAADALHKARAGAATALSAAAAAQLADLAMGDAALRVAIERDGASPPNDRVTMFLQPNPGLPESPLADSASGGELSRVLLALQSIAAAAEPDATWVFDEVDAGIGGVTATSVAAKLAELARTRQVIVITHLPQIAAVADRHYRLVKGVGEGGMARTAIEPVEGDALIDELCRMLGSQPTDDGARRHAAELLDRGVAKPVKPPAKKRRTAKAAS